MWKDKLETSLLGMCQILCEFLKFYSTNNNLKSGNIVYSGV